MIFRVENRISDAGLSGERERDYDGIKTAVVFAAVGMALAVLVAPTLQGAVETYAQNRSLGIDRVLTGGVQRGDRYTVRQSVLSDGVQKICEGRNALACVSK